MASGPKSMINGRGAVELRREVTGSPAQTTDRSGLNFYTVMALT
ncbi:MAG: hypothetical protein ABI903_16305 [Actinomycetota bacterium]